MEQHSVCTPKNPFFYINSVPGYSYLQPPQRNCCMWYFRIYTGGIWDATPYLLNSGAVQTNSTDPVSGGKFHREFQIPLSKRFLYASLKET